MSEINVQNKILDFLNKQKDFFAWRNNNGAVYSAKEKAFRKKSKFDINGSPDIICIHSGGLFVAIEVKSETRKAKPSKEQLVFLNKIKSMGGFAICTNNIDEVHTLVAEIRSLNGLARNK